MYRLLWVAVAATLPSSSPLLASSMPKLQPTASLQLAPTSLTTHLPRYPPVVRGRRSAYPAVQEVESKLELLGEPAAQCDDDGQIRGDGDAVMPMKMAPT